MIDKIEVENLINDLLKFSLKKFAAQLKFIPEEEKYFPSNKSAKLLQAAEYFSRSAYDDANRNKCLFISGLLWEYRNPEWKALPSFLTQILIRLGINTSARMINWNIQTNSFNGLGSLISELYATINLINHEVTVADNKLTISDFQKRIWDAFDKSNYIGISGPTSAGKSFVILNKIVDVLSKEDGKVIYIVPTISLINQVSNDFREAFRKSKITNVQISQTVSDKTFSKKVIYVLTQERALSALLNPINPFSTNIKALIIDEVQNIEKFADTDEERSKTLYDVIHEFKNDYAPEKIILSGPLLKQDNFEQLLEKWFGKDNFSCITDQLSPVLNLTYSFKKISKSQNILFIQNCIIGNKQEIEIEDKYSLKDFILGKKQYTGSDKTHTFLYHLLDILNKDSGTLIFSKSSSQCAKSAVALATFLDYEEEQEVPNTSISSLIEYVRDTVHPKYGLAITLSKGIAYHHGKVPHHVRNSIEKAFKEKGIKTILCTTTLMQGVNLPAKTLIVRNPDLSDGSLSSYEFANLRGRSGRLMQDFLGRAIVIDDKAFEDKNIKLSKFEGKELKSGYEERFLKHKDEIVLALGSNETINVNSQGSDLVIYIRQSILKYDNEAINRIKNAGIDLDQKLFLQIKRELQKLDVPREFCLNHPYWDPFDLNSLFNKVKKNELPLIPNSPFEFSFKNDIYNAILSMKEFPYYFKKYFNIEFDPKINSICSFAEKWAQGKPLKEIIDPLNWPIKSSEDVDDRIDTINSKVVYGITKLLKPLVHFQGETNSILSYIEYGAFEPKLRLLIGLGVPREASIRLLKEIAGNFIDTEREVNQSELDKFFKKVVESKTLKYWDKIQTQHLHEYKIVEL